MTDATYFELINLFPTYHDIIKLSNQIDNLTIDLNTQNIWVEIERAKRQKMKILMRQIRNETIHSNPMVNQLRQKIATLIQKIASVSGTYNSELARLSTITYRRFSRLHQILITIIPHLSMSPSDHIETFQWVTVDHPSTLHINETPQPNS